MDEQTQRSKESTNLDHGILLNNPIVSVSEENASSVGEDPKIGDLMDEGTSNSVIDGEIVSIREENKELEIQIDKLRLKTMQSDEETCAKRDNGEAVCAAGSADRPVPETVILVNSEENYSIGSGLGTSKVMGDDKSMKNVREEKKKSSGTDVRRGNGGLQDCDGERVCRICHLNCEGLAETKATGFSAQLTQLGCGCKDDLGAAHAYCAEAWFKLKGNRICEICGEMARNVSTGVGENRFMEEWNQRRYVGSSISIPSDGSNGCWRGQPFCNFLMACLVVAFVLPWFFRVNMF